MSVTNYNDDGQALRLKQNVLLINTPIWSFRSLKEPRAEYIQPRLAPMGLLYLASFVRSRGLASNIQIIDLNNWMDEAPKFETADEYVLDKLVAQVDIKPDIVGVSFMFSTSFDFFCAISRQARRLWPKACIAAGGNHATNAAKSLIDRGLSDFIIRGEGENSFTAFLEQVGSGRPVNVQGCYSRENLESAPRLMLSEPVTDLDELPLPAWDLVDMEQIVGDSHNRTEIASDISPRHAEFISGRGCHYRCTYCAGHTVHGRNVRQRSVENIVHEVKTLNELYGANVFIPRDDLFLADKKRFIEVMAALKKLNIPGFDLVFPNALSLRDLDDEVLDVLFETGIRRLVLAIESGSQHVQNKIIKKFLRLDKVKKTVELCRQKGFFVRANFIFGFPGETRELMQETIDFMKQIPVDWYVVYAATPLPGAEMWDALCADGIITDEPETWEKIGFHKRWYDTPEISAHDLNNLIMRLNLEMNFLNNRMLALGRYDEAIPVFEDIARRYPWHIAAWHSLARAYRGLDNMDQAFAIRDKIKQLLANEPNAAEHFSLYREIIPPDEAEWLTAQQ